MPKRPHSHELEDMSRNYLHDVFTRRGWTVENLEKDYGEDLLVRIFSKGLATPLAFFVQAKATDHLERYSNKAGTLLMYPISSDHIKHWEHFWEPVILALWDSKTGTTYWEFIQTFCETIPKNANSSMSVKTLRVQIPTDNTLDE